MHDIARSPLGLVVVSLKIRNHIDCRPYAFSALFRIFGGVPSFRQGASFLKFYENISKSLKFIKTYVGDVTINLLIVLR
jgi:hypothetical protein